jgi:hypothetical protein
MSVEDDDVTLWTSALDARFAKGKVVATIAAGNNGESDADSGLNRVQVPADGVNVLSVGAASSMTDVWERAAYSGVGPGRTPGRVKPDVVVFGGSDSEPFMVLGPTTPPRAVSQKGTSFAAPLALRSAVAVRATLGSDISPLTLRALLIHRADPASHEMMHVGWGRTEIDPLKSVTCDDDEATVLYQGELLVGQHLRATVPVPTDALTGLITLTATLVIAPDVDPEYPGAYTRSGLEVSFRPHDSDYRIYPNGKTSQQPKTRPFFSTKNMYRGAEYESREDGHKWEPCLKHSEIIPAVKLSRPVFDIYYHNRASGMAVTEPEPIPYALIVGLKCPDIPNFYDQIVRTYAALLTPLRPINRITLRP